MPEQNQNTEQKPKRKLSKTAKIVLGVLAVVFLFAIVDVMAHWQGWVDYFKARKDAEKIETKRESALNLLKEDIYGGDTPEETYNMFRDAMLKKDIDLAMKYVHINDREWVKKYFDDKIKDNKLDDYIKNDLLPIEKMRKEERDNGYVNFWYEKYVAPYTVEIDGIQREAGGFNNSFAIKLFQNLYTKKWKIVSP